MYYSRCVCNGWFWNNNGQFLSLPTGWQRSLHCYSVAQTLRSVWHLARTGSCPWSDDTCPPGSTDCCVWRQPRRGQTWTGRDVCLDSTACRRRLRSCARLSERHSRRCAATDTALPGDDRITSFKATVARDKMTSLVQYQSKGFSVFGSEQHVLVCHSIPTAVTVSLTSLMWTNQWTNYTRGIGT